MDKITNGYQIVDTLGEGGMACVYKAFDPSTNRTIALKLLKNEYSSNTFYRNRFLGEAKAAGHLSHPNIVTIYSVSKDDNKDLFIAMECLHGKTLEGIMRCKDRLPIDEVIRIGIQLANALDYAHKNGVIHRDIKPSNIMFSDENNEHIKITDFGIAHVDMMGQPGLTQTGMIMGTPEYMSPEQAQGEKIGKESDLFSTGVILYQLLCKHQPFYGDTWGKRYKQIVETAPKPVQSYYPDIPTSMWLIVKKLLDKSPGKRYQSGHDLAEALQAAKQSIEAKKQQNNQTPWLEKAIIASQNIRDKIVSIEKKYNRVRNNVKQFFQKYWLLCLYLVNNLARRIRLIPTPLYLSILCTSMILLVLNGAFYYIVYSQQQHSRVTQKNSGSIITAVIAQSIVDDIAGEDWISAETKLDIYQKNVPLSSTFQTLSVTDANNQVRIPGHQPTDTASTAEIITASSPIMFNKNIQGYVKLQMLPEAPWTLKLLYLLAALNILAVGILFSLFASTGRYLRNHLLEVSEKIENLVIGRPINPIHFDVGGSLGKLIVSFNHLLQDAQLMKHKPNVNHSALSSSSQAAPTLIAKKTDSSDKPHKKTAS